MDLLMPIMDGMEASRRIREWETGGERTFIVALTAAYLPEDGHRLFEVGIDNYIGKPFEIEHIERMLRYSITARPAFSTNQNVTFPQKLSSKEILDIHNGMEPIADDWPIGGST
jgi:DNA-binding response OmpR family regulator